MDICAVGKCHKKSEGSTPKARCAKKAARDIPSAKPGGAIEVAPKTAGGSKARKPDEWKVVSIRGDRGVVLRKQGVEGAQVKSLPVCNRFAVLSDDSASAATPVAPVEAKPEEGRGGKGLLVIGSSNVRRIMDPLRARARREGVCERVSSRCLPGGTIPKVTKELRTAIRSTGWSELRVLVHAGTNDASKFGSEVILDSFKDLITEASRVQSESGVRVSLTLCSIVPRTDRSSEVWSRILGLNRRL